MPNVTLVPLEEAARDPQRSITYTEFAGASSRPPQPPAFLFGSLPAYLAPDLFSGYDIPAVGCYHLHDAQVTCDGIILQNGQALWSLCLNHPDNHISHVLAHTVPNLHRLPVRRIPGQAAIIHGPGYNIFGHWLIDFLPRLYVLRRAGLDIGALQIILPRQAKDLASPLLELAGVPAENLIWHDHTKELLQPDELIAPTILRLRNRFHPLLGAASRYWMDRIVPATDTAIEQPEGRRLFISRSTHPGNRCLTSRAHIEARAADAGYEIVHPELLPMPQQMALFRSAGRIIGEYGSGLHGAICAPAGTAICALRGTSHHPGFAQSGLAECFAHNIGYVFGDTPEFAHDQALTIDAEAFELALAAMDIWGRDAGGDSKRVLF